MVLEFKLFGPFEVFRDGQPIPLKAWGSRQTRTILKILLAHQPQLVSGDRLVDLVWPDEPIESTRQRLHTRISQLRRVLDPGNPQAYVHTADNGYFFMPAPDCWIDTLAFEQHAEQGRLHLEAGNLVPAVSAWEAGCALYRGDFLVEDIYADWTLAERERLRDRFLILQTELAEAYAQQGRFRRAINLCSQILAVDNCREVVFARQMLYLYYSGDKSKALDVYQQCRDVLASELGVEPTQDTVRMANLIRDGRLWSEPDLPHYPPPAYEGRIFEVPYSLGRVPFVGRQREYSWLVSTWQANTPLLWLEGEAGVGKSRLAEEFLGYAAQQGARVLISHGRSPDRGPYAALLPALEELFASLPASTGLDVQASVIQRLLHDACGQPASPVDINPFPAPQELGAAISGWLKRHITTQIIWHFDDAHRLDEATLALLPALTPDITLLLTCRTEATAADHPLRKLLAEFKQDRRAAALTLNRLDQSATVALLSRLSPAMPKSLAENLYQQTQGNPLYLIAVLQNLFEQGEIFVDPSGGWQTTLERLPRLPQHISASIESRLQRISRAQRQILDVAAVSGGGLDLALLQAVCGSDETGLLAWVDGLLDAGFLSEPRHRGIPELEFSHPIYAQVVLQTMPQMRRRVYHLRVAESLEAFGRVGEAEAAVLAEHFYQAREFDREIVYRLRAGNYALRLYAPQQAARQFKAVLERTRPDGLSLSLVDQAQLYLGMGEALRLQGRYDSAMEYYTRALPISSGEIKQAAAYQMCLIGAMRGESLGKFPPLAEQLEAELLPGGDSWALAVLRLAQGFVALLRGEWRRARECNAAGLRIARRLRAGAASPPRWFWSRATSGLVRMYVLAGSYRRALHHAHWLLSLATDQEDTNTQAATLASMGNAFLGLGVYTQARDHFSRCQAIAVRAGDPRLQCAAQLGIATADFEQGDYAAAETAIQLVLEISGVSGDVLRQLQARVLLARLQAVRGQPLAAQQGLKMLRQLAARLGARPYEAQLSIAQARVSLDAGDVGAAQRDARHAEDLAAASRMARELGMVWNLLGEIAMRADGVEEPGDYFAKSQAILGQIGCRYELGRTLLNEADWLAAQGKITPACQSLDSASTIFAAIDAPHLHQRAVQQLARLRAIA